MKILSDTHIHSDNSFDAENTVLEMCQAAVENDISIIAITDHMEAPEIKLGDRSVFGNMIKQITNSVKDAEVANELMNGKLRVLRGMELGEPMHEPKLTKKAMAIADFDFVLASIHNIRNTEDFYYLNYDEVDVPDLLRCYFDELLETAENADFDSLAHLTYPLRYIIERTDIRPDLEDYSAVIDNILKTLVKRDKALEINTSGIRSIGITMPDIKIVKRFRELGGKYVTIGSDAHRNSDVGYMIEKGIETARTCGFEYFTVFEKRQPELIQIWY
ncbi:MAG: histidinol-phosphatase HisJ family protein [Ruminococcus sp.]|nr:histidinol-phosphatase HisJ family protein [Ruminococcus sp.]